MVSDISTVTTTNSFATNYYTRPHELVHTALLVITDSDAVILEALILADPNSEIVHPLAKGLLNKRRNGKWGSTQENTWAVLAFDKYIHGRNIPRKF